MWAWLKGQAVTDHDETTVEPAADAVVESLLPPPADPLGDAQRTLAQQLVDQAQAEGSNWSVRGACSAT